MEIEMETEMETMKNDIVLANTQPTATIPVVAQQNTTSTATQPISAQSAATQPTAIQPVAAAQPAIVDGCLNPVTVGLRFIVSAIIATEKLAVFIDTPLNQEQVCVVANSLIGAPV